MIGGIDLAKAQRGDDDIGVVFKFFETNPLQKPSKDVTRQYSRESQNIFNEWNKLEMINGILRRRSVQGSQFVSTAILPKELRKECILSIHSSGSGAHMGAKATRNKIKSRYWWPAIGREVEEVVKRCKPCQLSKFSNRPNRPAMQSIQTGFPFQQIHLDIAGPLDSNNGTPYILIMVDAFTGWTEAVPMVNSEAETLAKALVNEWICRYGCPLRLVTDRGANISGKIIHNVSRLLQIKKVETTAYHPQSNGKAERMIQTVKNLLKSMITATGKEWGNLLQLVLMAYRSSPHNSTGYTPFYMMHGFEMIFPEEIQLGSALWWNADILDYTEKLQKNLKIAHGLARNNLKQARRRQKINYDKWSRPTSIKPGKMVLKKTQGKRKRELPNPHHGPYKVLHEVRKDVFKILLPDGTCEIVNGKALLPFHDSEESAVESLTSDSESDVREDEDLQSLNAEEFPFPQELEI